MKFTNTLSVIAKKALTVMAVSTVFLSSLPLTAPIINAEETSIKSNATNNNPASDNANTEEISNTKIYPEYTGDLATTNRPYDQLPENERPSGNDPISSTNYITAPIEGGGLIEWGKKPSRRSKREIGTSGGVLTNQYGNGVHLSTFYITVDGKVGWCADPGLPEPHGAGYRDTIHRREDLTNILVAAEMNGWTSGGHYVNVWGALNYVINHGPSSYIQGWNQIIKNNEVKYLIGLANPNRRTVGAFYHVHMDAPAEKVGTWTKVNDKYVLETPMYYVRSDYPSATFTFSLPGQYASKLFVVKDNGQVIPAGQTVTINNNQGFKIRALDNTVPRISVKVNTNVRNKIAHLLMPTTGNFQRILTLGYDNPLTTDFAFSFTDETQPRDYGKLWLKKVDENGNGLAGATFKVSYNGTSETITSKTTPVLVDDMLPIGTKVTIEEISAPDGYIRSAAPQTVTITKDSIDNPITVTFTNQKIHYGSLYLKKQDLKNNLLNGAKFAVTINGNTKEYTVNGRTLIADHLPVGTQVTIREVQAPTGFQRTLESKTITITESTTENAPEVIFTNKPQKGKLLLTKEDAQTGNTAQGAASLNGAVYELRKKSDNSLVETITFDGTTGTAVGLELGEYILKEVKAPKGYTLNTTPIPITISAPNQDASDNVIRKTVTDTIIKGGIKGIKYGNKTLLSQFIDALMKLRELGVKEEVKPVLEGVELTATSKTTGKTYKAITDKNGYFEINNLPYDTYTLSETKGKTGYRLIKPFDFTVNENGQVHNYTLVDNVIENKIKVVKKDKETGKIIARSQASFKIYDRQTKKYVAYENAGKQITEIFTTDNTGTFTTSTPLPYGKDRYELHEVIAPNGYIRETKPIVFSIDTKSNEEVITLTFVDNSQKGKATIIKEIENIAGYTKSATIINSATYDYYKPNMNFVKGQGFQFKIRARENIVTNDSTTRMTKGQYVQKDGKDLILTTDANGTASTDANLYLGKYEFIEVAAPAGYHLDNEPIPFELKYAGQDVQVATTNATKQNLRTVESLVANFKLEERATGFKNKQAVIEKIPASHKIFGLYAAQDVTIGSLKLTKDTRLSAAETYNGQITFNNLKLPNQTMKMYIQEINAGPNHVLDTTKHEFTYKPEGNRHAQVVNIDIPNVTNKLAKANVHLFKFDRAQHIGKETPIKGVTFILYGNINGKEQTVGEFITDANGNINVNNLPVGAYRFVEKAPLAGYEAYTQSLNFNVNLANNDQTIQLKAENKRLPITIGTQATFENGAKTSNPYKAMKLVDTISYTNVIPGKKYVWHTSVVDAKNANNIIASSKTAFTPKEMNGTFKINMTVDGTKLRGKDIVFFEELRDAEEEGYVWATHKDIKDKGQTITIRNPQIGTKASFLNGSQSSDPFKKVTVNDVISYKDVVKGRNYKLVTKLVKVDNPKEVVTEKATAFTPEDTEGETTVSVEIDASQYRGQKLVFFEYLYDQEKEEELQSKHEDKDDENQTVTISNPNITTLARNKAGDTLLDPNDPNTIVESAEIKGLIPGNTYKLIAKGAIRKAGEVNFTLSKDLVAEKEFVADKEEMTIEFEFNIDAKELYNATVSFEEHLEAINEDKQSEEIADHNTDHTVEKQSVTFDSKKVTPTTPSGRLMQTGAKLIKGLPIIGVILVISALGIIIYKRKFATANQATVEKSNKVRKVSTKNRKNK